MVSAEATPASQTSPGACFNREPLGLLTSQPTPATSRSHTSLPFLRAWCSLKAISRSPWPERSYWTCKTLAGMCGIRGHGPSRRRLPADNSCYQDRGTAAQVPQGVPSQAHWCWASQRGPGRGSLDGAVSLPICTATPTPARGYSYSVSTVTTHTVTMPAVTTHAVTTARGTQMHPSFARF